MVCSMSRKGNCWDNAPTKSWFNSFKNEWVHGLCFETHEEMKAMSFEYMRCATTENGSTRRWATSHQFSFWMTGSLLSEGKNW